MPVLGERIRGVEIGRKDDRARYIWKACVDCGTERWVRVDRQGFRCSHCAGRITTNGHGFIGLKGKESINWRGGRVCMPDGYIKVWCEPDSCFTSMRNGNYILEHRLVMAQYLGRALLNSEMVHHKNGIKDDNRIENLYLCNKTEHSAILVKEIKRLYEIIGTLEEKVKKLEEEER